MEVKAFTLSPRCRGQRILLRASLNVPLQNGVVSNPFRLDRALQTIEELSLHGARVIVLGHIGREQTASLKPVFEALRTRAKVPIQFCDGVSGKSVEKKVQTLRDGDVLLLENVRRDARETANDPTFAAELALLGDVYVNDAFSDAHRRHASIVGIPKLLPSFAGPRFMEELRGIQEAITPKSPSLAIVGGAKFITKEPLLKTLLTKYDRVFVGGALANDFLEAQGHSVGASLTSPHSSAKELLKDSKLLLPTDVAVLTADEKKVVKKVDDIQTKDQVYDVGPASIKKLAPHIEKARTILWNGPLGNFEAGFDEATNEVAKLIAETKAVSVVGGGDTIAAIEKLHLSERFSFVSTAGGAMLQFISEGTLPGIEVLQEETAG